MSTIGGRDVLPKVIRFDTDDLMIRAILRGLAPKTEADRLLAARMEAAHRRMAEMGYKPHRPLPRFGVPAGRPITIVEILHAGRRRAALSRVESNPHESTQQTLRRLEARLVPPEDPNATGVPTPADLASDITE